MHIRNATGVSPAWMSYLKGELPRRGCLLAAEKLLAAYPEFPEIRVGQAVLWVHLMQIVRARLSLSKHVDGKGKALEAWEHSYTNLCLCFWWVGAAAGEMGSLSWFSLWVCQLEFRVAVCRCDASRRQC